MFRSLKNSRLGKYYSSVRNKYGVLIPFLTALCAFVLLYLVDTKDIIGMLGGTKDTAGIVTIVVLCICFVSMLYYALSKLAIKQVNAIDFIAYAGNMLAVMLLIEVITVSGTTLRTVLFVVGIVLMALLTLMRMSVVKFTPVSYSENLVPDATFKKYSVYFAKKFSLPLVIFFGLLIFAIVYIMGMSGKGLSQISTMTVIIIALLLLSFMLSLPRRIASARMGHMDFFMGALDIAAILSIIPVALNFGVEKLVIWLAAVAACALFSALLVKNTHIEEIKKCKEANGDKRGFVPYFRQFARSYNVFLASALGLIAFVVLYAVLSIDLLKDVSETASIIFYIVMCVLIVSGMLCVLLSARRKYMGSNDFIGFVLTVTAVLLVIPAVQYFTALKFVCWLLLVLILVAVLVLRMIKVKEVEVERAEVYSPAAIFSKENCLTVLRGIKKTFEGGEKDSHYISNKESRKIARENMRITKSYEKEKKRKNVPESEYVTQMRDDRNIVEFDNLHTYFFSDAGVVKAVNGVSFDIPQGSTVGVVGESGCGKSVTSLSLMQLVQAPKGQVIRGSEIRFKSTVYKKDENGNNIPVYEVKLDENGNEMHDEHGNPIYVTALKMHKGKPVLDDKGHFVLEKVQKKDENGIPLFETEEKVYNVAKMPTEVMRKIRGREITMIFQEPMTSLNPIFTIGNQLDEVVLLHVPGATKASAKARTYEMLNMVGIIPENVYDRYPHELSGGMRQRVMIAMALSCHPKLIIADEPTTALDVTIQAQILDLLRDIKKKINGSIMLITHDLGVIAEMADYVVVMYAGRIIEMGTAKEIFDNPLHPYTMGLQKSKPAVNKKVDRLYSIPGSVPNPINMPNYCYFRDRCDKRCDKCNGDYPNMIQVSPTHKVSCHLYEKEDANNGNQ